MQQELIEMLEEIIQYVEVWNAHDQGILNKAEALIEKAKNSAKEPAVPQGEPVGVVYSFPSGDGNTAWGFKPNDSAWEVEKQPKSYERRFNVYLQATPATPPQPVTLTDEDILRCAALTLGEQHVENCGLGDIKEFASAIIAALREKGHPMSNTKTKAQRLADWLDADACDLLTPREAASELLRLETENQQLKTSLALVQQHHATAWNRGHQAGIRAGESAVKQATDAVKADAWGNTQLTNALIQAEAERDQLRAQLAKAVAEEREACAELMEQQHTWITNIAASAAIRARSNT